MGSSVNQPPIKSARAPVIASVMASMCMVAIEATIVSTAMPQIVADLGGLRLYSWVFSAFLLAQTALTVVFGNLADIYGRKPIMLTGIAIFVLGSLLAGFAWSMPVDDSIPARPGRRRRSDAACGHDHRRRSVSGARTGQGPGLSGQRLGDIRRARTRRRRAHHPQRFLVVDLLDQPPDRLDRGRRLHRLPAREHQARAPLDRCRRSDHLYHRGRLVIDRPDGNRELEHRGARGGSRCVLPLDRGVRAAGAADRQSDGFLRLVEPPADRGRQRRRLCCRAWRSWD